MTKEINNLKREYPERPFAAVGVVVIKESQVLLIKRNKAPKPQMWSIPGGAQELGERLQEAAAREVYEETGINIKNIALLDAIDFIEKGENERIKFHYSLIDYLAEYDYGELSPGDDAFAAKWVSFDDLGSYNLWQETTNIILKARSVIR